ncbi:MAG: hypothetical protein ACYC7E_01540 [Armatimonadota bacterium]
MRKKLVPGLLIAAGIAVAWFLIIWPIVDDELQKVPVVNAINAVRGGKTAALRACFTDDAQAVYRDKRIGISAAIHAAAPLLESSYFQGSVRFGGYADKQRVSRDRVKTNATIWVYLEGGELPYRRVPNRKIVQVLLQRVGWFTWKIQEVGSDDEDFGSAIER